MYLPTFHTPAPRLPRIMSHLDLEPVRTEFRQTVARVSPLHLELAQRTLERIPAARWQLEWFLPWWLGEAFGLEENTARQFVLSNVLGLAAVRLQDDLADGDVAPGEMDSVSEFTRTLTKAALDMYRPYFPPNSRFWTYAASYMAEWRAATAAVNRLNLADLWVLNELKHAPTQCLAHLGSPLKIGARAVCELSSGERFSGLDELLDHSLIAAVLHDHAVDCNADLRAGRWNLFVAAVSPLPQTRAHEQENRASVVEAWMTRKTPRLYFEQIALHIERA